jgi:hypothetical protein
LLKAFYTSLLFCVLISLDFGPYDFSDYKDAGSQKKGGPLVMEKNEAAASATASESNWSKVLSLPGKNDVSKAKGVSSSEDPSSSDDDDDDEDEDEDIDDNDVDDVGGDGSEEDVAREVEGPNKSSSSAVLNPGRMEEIRRESSSLCSPQEYEILKVREKTIYTRHHHPFHTAPISFVHIRTDVKILKY